MHMAYTWYMVYTYIHAWYMERAPGTRPTSAPNEKFTVRMRVPLRLTFKNFPHCTVRTATATALGPGLFCDGCCSGLFRDGCCSGLFRDGCCSGLFRDGYCPGLTATAAAQDYRGRAAIQQLHQPGASVVLGYVALGYVALCVCLRTRLWSLFETASYACF